MGNVEFVYRRAKGSKDEGAPIAEGADAFEMIADSEYDNVMAMFNACSPEKQAEIRAIFPEDADVFSDAAALEGWVAGMTGQEDELNAAFEKIKQHFNQ